jgi:hypothetical protein
MPSIINASSSSTGLLQSADASGILQLQSNGTTGLTVGSGGLLTAANGIVMSSMTLGSAVTGEFEYDGRVPYFTPLGTQRGVIPGMQYFRLNSDRVGSNVNTAQSLFGVGVTLSSSTVYAFESVLAISKTAGTTSHTTGLGFGGTATINNIGYHLHNQFDATAFTTVPYSGTVLNQWINSATNTTISGGSVSPGAYRVLNMRGTVSINAGGTFIPQYTLSAAPGGAYTTAVGSYFLIYPIGASGSNINVGTWA